MDKFKCCLCGNETEGWGNNPWPIVDDENSLCCSFCNEVKVIPIRLKWMQGHYNKNLQEEFTKL